MSGKSPQVAFGDLAAEMLYAPTDPLCLTHFAVMDALRQLQGEVLEAFGLEPAKSHYRVVSSGPHWRLRAYTPGRGWASVLVVAAPIKRPYIWDLTDELSAIRYCVSQRLCMYLLEWAPATRGRAAAGLDEYAGSGHRRHAVGRLPDSTNTPVKPFPNAWPRRQVLRRGRSPS